MNRSMSTLARSSLIVEVSARDGLQNLKPPAVPTAVKKELVERLLDTGLKVIEVGSFVRPDRVPQMADTPTLLPGLPSLRSEDPEVHYPVLVPNMRGLQSLLELEAASKASDPNVGPLTNEIAVFVSATEPFSKANNNASVDKVLSGLPAVIDKALERGYRVRGYVSCVMTDPLLDMGCYEVSLGDTTGEGNPEAWKTLWEALLKEDIPTSRLAAHCHDTFSMALPSILALLPLGLRIVDSSLAGLGGCPYSPGATGNVATEDVVYALHKLGYNTGVDLEKLVKSGNWLTKTIGISNESKVGRAIGARLALKEKAK
ncbi:3-hydroxymethyl-3-methylglutaryl-CoA lyase, cytoplasmic [Vanrija pseudolonga]|uniref:hydroxymethylglutaryl-CoA lyase n=1 Tax=Vanrija pseudolonga TaxID=143232 RepID=A0AAF1BRC2_9TREE|nr:3-hydroxymethyl-3-methylglutaryl-CoA lyase, cytoplasmic [Vanrija pseudolonga]